MKLSVLTLSYVNTDPSQSVFKTLKCYKFDISTIIEFWSVYNSEFISYAFTSFLNVSGK